MTKLSQNFSYLSNFLNPRLAVLSLSNCDLTPPYIPRKRPARAPRQYFILCRPRTSMLYWLCQAHEFSVPFRLGNFALGISSGRRGSGSEMLGDTLYEARDF